MVRPMSTTTQLRATGYGDMKGSPEAENPQDQGASSDAKQNAEHPGPAPPSEGKGTGKGPTKAGGQKEPADASAQSGGSRSKEAKETGSSPTGGKVGGGGKRQFSTSTKQWMASSSSKKEAEETVQKARQSETSKEAATPKIISDGDPAEGQSQEKKQEVEQHNKEFEERYDRAQPATDNKVDHKFWKGES